MIRHSVLVPLEFSGHGSFYDQKDVFNDILVKFIENCLNISGIILLGWESMGGQGFELDWAKHFIHSFYRV